MRSFRSLLSLKRGAAVMEFAFGLPLLATFAWGACEYGRTLYVQTQLNAAATEAARAMALHAGTDDDALEYMVLAALPQYEPGAIAVDIQSDTDMRIMTLTLTHELIVPIGDRKSLQLTSVRYAPVKPTLAGNIY